MIDCACIDGIMWELAITNEDGWKCDRHGAIGYRPDLDRKHIGEKVRSVVFWLHEHGFIYVSNGTMGDVIEDNVVEECQKRDRFDQLTITQLVLADPNLWGHSDYWANEAAGWPRLQQRRAEKEAGQQEMLA